MFGFNRDSGLWRRIHCSVFILTLTFGLSVAAPLGIDQALLVQIQSRYGKEAKARIIHWQELLRTDKNLPEQEKLKKVNEFFNQIDFVDDQYHWGEQDYWATPFEMLATNGGDCEDFSLAKYYTLIELGVPEEKLRLTYVKAVKLNQAHMVLTFFPTPQAVPLVLDNLVGTIDPATKRKDLIPVYSFNGTGLWLAKSRGSGQHLGSSGRLSLWQEVTERMQKKQFKSSLNNDREQ